MTSTSDKPFHTYENVGYDDQTITSNNHLYATPPLAAATATTTQNNVTTALATNNNANNSNTTTISSGLAINKTAMELPFPDPMHDTQSSAVAATTTIPSTTTARILSATDSSGTTRMLTAKAVPGQNLVTKLISLPSQSPMDSLKEWSVSTFKCTKQLINEKRGLCSITNDAQLQADIDHLRENRSKLVHMLRTVQQMTNHYTQLVRDQRQLHGLMNEMSIKCFTNSNGNSSNPSKGNHSRQSGGSKHIIANFSSLSNNLSSTTTTDSSHSSPQPAGLPDNLLDFSSISNHITSANVNLTDDFKKNAMALNANIKNGEKLVSALNFFCSNLATLINKTIEDTLVTVKQYESARLEYDAERNSLNIISPSAQTSITYSSDKMELARVRYEQLKEDIQIKMKFLEENTVKVMHKQLLLFNGAFASYSSGNTAALDHTLKQFNIR